MVENMDSIDGEGRGNIRSAAEKMAIDGDVIGACDFALGNGFSGLRGVLLPALGES